MVGEWQGLCWARWVELHTRSTRSSGRDACEFRRLPADLDSGSLSALTYQRAHCLRGAASCSTLRACLRLGDLLRPLFLGTWLVGRACGSRWPVRGACSRVTRPSRRPPATETHSRAPPAAASPPQTA